MSQNQRTWGYYSEGNIVYNYLFLEKLKKDLDLKGLLLHTVKNQFYINNVKTTILEAINLKDELN